jgi:hypothetical protein
MGFVGIACLVSSLLFDCAKDVPSRTKPVVTFFAEVAA